MTSYSFITMIKKAKIKIPLIILIKEKISSNSEVVPVKSHPSLNEESNRKCNKTTNSYVKATIQQMATISLIMNYFLTKALCIQLSLNLS